MIAQTDKYNFSFPIQIRWNDLDALGHVNNAVFVTYFEIARGFYMLHSCSWWDWKKDMFLIANITVDFHKELLLTSKDVKVFVKTSTIGTKSFVLDYIIVSESENQEVIHATGSTTQVMFDMEKRATINIPDLLRDNLLSFDTK
jgi:acyl-CoA thioester hydrolase